jgi:hypothetical protein
MVVAVRNDANASAMSQVIGKSTSKTLRSGTARISLSEFVGQTQRFLELPVLTATTICEANESLNAGSVAPEPCGRRLDDLFRRRQLSSNLSIDASSASNDAVIPNDTMQQTCITRIPAFTGADYKESCHKTK